MGQKHRFYIESFSATNIYKLIEKDFIHQCTKVLRLRTGDFVYFFNGKDNFDYKYQVVELSSKTIQFSLEESIEKEFSDFGVILYQALPNKLSKLEYIVQKCCEVGVKKVIFFEAHYSQDSKFLSNKKQERLEKISKEACEQSNRNRVMELDFEKKLDFSTIVKANNVCFHTDSSTGKKLKDLVVDKHKDIQIFVGAEGGFHESEISNFQKIDTQFIYLGNNILRTETTGAVNSFYFIQNFYN